MPTLELYLLRFLVAVVLLFSAAGAGGYYGYKYRADADELVIAREKVAAADAARADALASAAAASKVESDRHAAQIIALNQKHALELELEHDQAAHTCGISDNAFRMLQQSRDSANGASNPSGQPAPTVQSGAPSPG